MPAHNYSHSRLETYGNCPQQYKLQYIDKVDVEETESVEAFLGSQVHETLEKLYKDVRMTKVPPPEDVLACYEDLWDKNWRDGIKIVRADYTADHYREIGRRCIKEYYETYHPFDQTRTIALEQLVMFPLDEDQQYWIRGVIDRIAQGDDGTYEIHDYKTSGRLPTQGDVDKDRQLALYHVALQNMWPDVKDVDLVWHYLVFGKELRSRRTVAELATLKQEVLEAIRTIEGDDRFSPRESALCDWCPYPEYCPAKRHGMMMANLTPNEYLEEPGVKLANRYAELSQQKDHLDGDLARVKEALIHYAREHGVEVIKGSDHRVLVRFYRGISFPTKDQPGRKELEELVKKAGLWEEVSVMSPVSLSKLVEGGKLDSALADQLGRMGREEERPWVKLSRLRRYD